MAQGTRVAWKRAVQLGLGALLCVGSVGCLNPEKDKMPPKIGANNGKPVTPGLPGAMTLPGQPGTGLSTTRTPQSGMNGIQQTGGTFGNAAPPGRPMQPVTPPGAGLGNGMVPNAGPTGMSNGAGFGGGAPQPTFENPSSPNRGGAAFAPNTPAPDLNPVPPLPPAGFAGSNSNYQPVPPQPIAPPNPNGGGRYPPQ